MAVGPLLHFSDRHISAQVITSSSPSTLHTPADAPSGKCLPQLICRRPTKYSGVGVSVDFASHNKSGGSHRLTPGQLLSRRQSVAPGHAREKRLVSLRGAKTNHHWAQLPLISLIGLCRGATLSRVRLSPSPSSSARRRETARFSQVPATELGHCLS